MRPGIVYRFATRERVRTSLLLLLLLLLLFQCTTAPSCTILLLLMMITGDLCQQLRGCRVFVVVQLVFDQRVYVEICVRARTLDSGRTGRRLRIGDRHRNRLLRTVEPALGRALLVRTRWRPNDHEPMRNWW
uniref:Putative secreted protein n=1 Tax=Anopheles darlingi TaxID=43151 RepID=A0A2M4DDU1_ANODA